jgi:hypothetical protein
LFTYNATTAASSTFSNPSVSEHSSFSKSTLQGIEGQSGPLAKNYQSMAFDANLPKTAFKHNEIKMSAIIRS